MATTKFNQKYLNQLTELGIKTPIQALYYFPKSIQYIELTPFTPELEMGVFRGIVQAKLTVIRGKVPFVRFTFITNDSLVPVICFNQSYLTQVLEAGSEVVIVAKKSKRNWVVSKVYYKNIDAIGNESEYSLTKGMRQNKFREYLQYCLEHLTIDNFIPDALHKKYRLISRATAFQYMHFPANSEEKEQAIRYFKYEEAFLFYLNLFLRKKEMQEVLGKNKKIPADALNDFTEQLPFALTSAQKRVLNEIIRDITSSKIMHRLIQGDVGSGKTIVALLTAYLEIKAGYQAVFLAPTTILAEQHLKEAQKYLAPLGINIAFLRSQTKKDVREELLTKLAAGELDLLIGTHAVLEDDVVFNKLGFAIIDEQQRFGVEQRKKLRQKGDLVDMIYMSATPIPRTLAISIFGDLSVSTIDELPAGRQKIETRIVQKRFWSNVIKEIIATVERGEQVYVVCPLIEESEVMELGDVNYVFELLRQDMPTNMTIAMLHGKQKNEEKNTIIEQFAQEKIQVLVSTTVVEVGVHVDKATLMIIYDAQQFGLSQLHQLRGRVGRNSRPAKCLLISDQKNKRLQLLESSQDGFFLAQQDLELRGPGDFFGQKQSGLPTFRLINLLEDINILEVAKTDAMTILAELAIQKTNDYDKIKQYVEVRKKEITDFID